MKFAGVYPARFRSYKQNGKQQYLRIDDPEKTVLIFKTGYGCGALGSFDTRMMNSSKCSLLSKIYIRYVHRS